MTPTYPLTHLLVGILMGMFCLFSPAVGFSNDLIESVQVEGARRIDADTVLSYVELEKGDLFDATALRTSMKALYETGYFKDVSLDREGNRLIIRVTENPMVDSVTFNGNKAFDDEELGKMVKLKPQVIYTRAQTEQDLDTLQMAYRAKGLFLATVDIQIKPTENNQINVTYTINEGEKSKVREVRIVGNHELTDKALLKGLMIHPTDWFSWYTEEDTYDKEKLQFDSVQLKNKYLDEGYVRASVDSSIAELTADRRAFIVTHTVREGSRYRLGTIQLVSDFDELSLDELRQELNLTEGEWYSRKNVKESVDRLTDRIGDYGFAFLKINPQVNIRDEERLVDITFEIQKGRRAYVNRIEIAGNTRTHDEVIRREISMVEGSLFSASEFRKSKQNIGALGYFEKIDVTTPIASDPEKVDVRIEVEEKPTGSFSLGAGYSSTDAFMGTASVSQNNFLGRGQKLSFSFALSSNTTDYNLSFTEPYFMGRKVSGGFDLYNRKTEPTSANSYETKLMGGGLRLGFPISKNLSNSVGYRLNNVEVSNTGNSYSRLTQAQADDSPYLQSMISDSLRWNSVDSATMPTTGRIHALTADFSGLGGDVKFARLTTDHHFYKPITEDGEWVGLIKGRAGYSTGVAGKELPIFERFQLGGAESIRGFKRGGLGPRTNLDEAYGGDVYETLSAEVLFPIYGLKEHGVRGFVFVDSANLTGTNLPSDVSDDASVRVSTGVGVNWNSPFGPLKLIFASPLVKGEKDQTRLFDFTMGTAF